MPAKSVKSKSGKRVYGPYKGSKQNGGRPIMVVVKKNGKTTSTNKARHDYEKRNGKLPKHVDVDHKDNGGRRGSDHPSNLRAMTHSANVAKENMRRAGRKKPLKKPKKG